MHCLCRAGGGMEIHMNEKQDPSYHQAERYRSKGVESTKPQISKAIKEQGKLPIKEIIINDTKGDNISSRSAVLAQKYSYRTGKYAAIAGKSVAGGMVRTGVTMTFKRAEYGGGPKALLIKVKSGLVQSWQSIHRVIKIEIKSVIKDFQGSDDLGIQTITKTRDVIISTKYTIKTTKTAAKGTYKTVKTAAKGTYKTVKTGVNFTAKAVNTATQLVAKLLVLITTNPFVLFGLVIVMLMVSVFAMVMSIVPVITLKSDDKELANIYYYVTELDAMFVETIKGINCEDHPFLYGDVDEFHFYVNGAEIDLNNFEIYTSADYVLMYLDCKYEDYALDKFIYGLFGGTNVKDEVTAIHAALNTYEESRRDELREHITIDDEGNEITETETVRCLDVNISTSDFELYFNENWESLLNESEKEMLDVLMEVGCYTTRVELGNPFVDTNNGTYSVNSRWGQRFHPISGELRPHRGIDIPQPFGTPINNVMSGRVIDVGYDADGWGNYVRVANNDESKDVLYAHMSSVAVANGDQVSLGEIIGYVGSTGVATGPHLHLEYNILNGFNTNPAFYLKGASYTDN